MNATQFSMPRHAANQCSGHGEVSLSFAKLLTPNAVSQATRGQSKRVQLETAGNWVLAGTVSAPMLKLLCDMRDWTIQFQVSEFLSSKGVPYVILAHQVGVYQSRFLIPVFDARACQFIEGLTNSVSLMVSLGNDALAEAVLLPCHLQASDFLPALSISTNASPEVQLDALEELPFVVETARNHRFLPGIKGADNVQNVSVSLLMPEMLGDYYEKLIHQAAMS
jgi:hypothetical protein